jgi:hypothetical protein
MPRLMIEPNREFGLPEATEETLLPEGQTYGADELPSSSTSGLAVDGIGTKTAPSQRRRGLEPALRFETRTWFRYWTGPSAIAGARKSERSLTTQQVGAFRAESGVMTERDAFTADQWRSLVDAAPAIARAIAATVGSASQTVGELGAFVRLVDRTASDDPGGLLGAIVSDLHGRLAGGIPAERPVDHFMNGIEAARIAGAILSVEAAPVEGERVCAWFLSVAQVVAEATREGGVLGIGGEQVSQHERLAIAAIRDALGVTGTEEA